MWQQVYTVCLGKTRNLQCSWSMVHNCMKWHTSSPPSGAPSPGPESTTAPSVDPPASSWCQESPFSCLGKIKNRDGKKSKRAQISGWYLKTDKSCWDKTPTDHLKCVRSILALLKLEEKFSHLRWSHYLNLQLGILDLQHSRVLSSLSLLVQVQFCIQQFLLCLNIKLTHIKKDGIVGR